jgi:hypothetical protein
MTTKACIIIAMQRLGLSEAEINKRIRFATLHVPDAPTDIEIAPGHEEAFIADAMAFIGKFKDHPIINAYVESRMRQDQRNN